MKKKNLFIELLRFIFCLIILFHHSGFLTEGDFPFKQGGLYAVEFFFILTGALAIKHIENDKPKEKEMAYSVRYTIRKLGRVFPYAATGIVLSYIWNLLNKDPSLGLKDKLWGIWNIVLELLYLPMLKIMDTGLNTYMDAPLWYLSVLLIVLPVVLYMAIKIRDVYRNYLSYVLALGIYAFLIQKFNSIGTWGNYIGVVDSGVLRGLAGIMLGTFAGYMSISIGSIGAKVRDVHRIILTIIELFGYIFSIYIFNSKVDGYTYLFAILILTVSIIISLSEISYTARINLSFLEHLGKLSLPLYCLHWPVYKLIRLYGAGISYNLGLLLCLVICIVIAEILFNIGRIRKS